MLPVDAVTAAARSSPTCYPQRGMVDLGDMFDIGG